LKLNLKMVDQLPDEIRLISEDMLQF
jgi:hypothetical protein